MITNKRKVLLKVFPLCVLSLLSFNVLSDSTKKEMVKIVDDIYVPCYVTARVHSGEYSVINSSPPDCGKVSKGTGRLISDELDLPCPTGYYRAGRVSGGPVGSYRSKIFYRAEVLCRFDMVVPLSLGDV
jgi:hypothetical protein